MSADLAAVLQRMQAIAVRYEAREIEARPALEEMLGELDRAGYSPVEWLGYDLGESAEIFANDEE